MNTVEKDRELIDTVSYVASLISRVEEVDSTLDTLRYITAKWDLGTQLSDQDRAALEALLVKLKVYLVNEDPLRSFTTESLETRILANAAGGAPKPAALGKFMLVSFICLLLAAGTILIPSSLPVKTRAFIAVPASIVIIAIVNSYFYVSAFRNFKASLKQSLLYLCLGTFLVAIQFVQYSSIPLLKIADQPLFRHGGVPFPTLLAFIFFYLGIQKYAQVLSIKKWYSSGLYYFGSILLAGIMVIGAGYLIHINDGFYHTFPAASVAGVTITSIFSILLTRDIMKDVTASYAHSIRALYIFNLTVTPSSLTYGSACFFFHTFAFNNAAAMAILGGLAIPPVLFLMHSGYSFKAETR